VRSGTPATLATSRSGEHVGAIAVGPDTLYYGTIADDMVTGGQLRGVALATGVESVMADGVQVAQIRLDSEGSVYYVADAIHSTAQRLWQLKPGASPEVVHANDYAIADFAPFPDEIVTADSRPGGGAIGKPTELIQQLMEMPYGLAVDARGVDSVFYWTSGSGPGHLTRMTEQEAARSARATVLATAPGPLAGPILDGPDLYFVRQRTGDCQGAVMVIPSAGGTPALVSAGHSGSGVSSFAVDEGDTGFVYWTTPDAGGLVFRAAKGGAMPEVVATAQPNARAVAVDATRVYWVATGPQGDEVRAVAK
jgi:hypothetical protein